tara:strand:+ start:165 stop:320 length:156 start_codon:yes stop_codon:yes gene_type:complete
MASNYMALKEFNNPNSYLNKLPGDVHDLNRPSVQNTLYLALFEKAQIKKSS